MVMDSFQKVLRVGLNAAAYAAVGLGAWTWAPTYAAAVHSKLYLCFAAVVLPFTVFANQAFTRLGQVDQDLKKFPAVRSARAYRYIHTTRTRLTWWVAGVILSMLGLGLVAGLLDNDLKHYQRVLYVVGYSGALTLILASIRVISAFLEVNRVGPKILASLELEETRANALAGSIARLSELSDESGRFTPSRL